ncbi:thioredoxin [Teladorsagia circumcincta]|uniref:Thioredoxin n=1 Tax=Teladorsagia circumcincta TaxID=45464 RepID=A0A2G9UV63_TELCI|nr:thioredoxin [Teladorsagia circumcincta]
MGIAGMILPQLKEAKNVLTLYHLLNAILSITFLCTKGVPEICRWIFVSEDGECALDSEELDRDRKSIFVIQFYTTWSPDCKHATPVFAQLSERFSLPNLRFGKLDVGRWPKEAERFRVNAHPTSRQLPTICVFKDAKEIKRRPLVNEKRRAIPFVFSQVRLLEFGCFKIQIYRFLCSRIIAYWISTC